MNLKVCVVGYGLMGKTHAEMYALDDRVSKIDVIDPVIKQEGKSEESALSKMEFFKWDDNNRNYDVISICVPTSAHYSMFLQYKDQTKNFLIEKPLTRSLDDAYRMENHACKSKLNIGCAFVERFNPVLTGLKSKIKPNSVGVYSLRRLSKPSSWYLEKHISGGPLLDLGVHDIDPLHWFSDSTIEVNSVEASNDKVYANLHLSNGSVAEMLVGWSKDEFINNITYVSEKLQQSLDVFQLDAQRYPFAYQQEIKGFLDFVEGKQNDFPTIKDGIKAQEIVEKINTHLN